MSLTNLQWCKARILVPGNPLVASLPFAPPGERDALLVLRTLVGELAAIPGTVSDPGVAAQKLQWWQQALAEPEQQAHPALQAAAEVGLPQRLDAGAWNGLVEGVRASLEPRRFELFEELWAYCRDIGGVAAALEARLFDSEGDLEPFTELGASGYLTRIVRDLALDARQGRWLLSLDLQAQFQIDRQQVAAGVGGRNWHALVLELLVRAHQRRGAALADIEPENAWRHRHLLINAALDARLGRMLARRPGRILKKRVLPGALGNLYVAWRTARCYA